MNINTDESDCIVVQKGGKGGGDVGSKIRGAGAGFERGEGESGVQSLRGEEEGTQGRAEALEGVQDPSERPKRAAGRPKKAATPAASFEAAAEAGRKRSAEWSLADQVAGLRAAIEGLAKRHQEREDHLQEETRSLKKELGDLKETIQAWREDQVTEERTKKQEQKAFQAAVQDEHQKQGVAVQEVQALLKEKSKTPSYSEVARTPVAQPEQP
jgi:hypothetical protein